MLDASIGREILGELSKLPTAQQREVLQFARFLAQNGPVGTPGNSFLQFAGTIPGDDLTRMAQVIESGCEQVSPDEW